MLTALPAPGTEPDAAPIETSPRVPPLSRAARVALGAMADDRDRLGEAWHLVADDLDVPASSAGDVPVPLDVAAVLADPEAWRGRAVRVAGRLEQRAPAGDAGDAARAAEEWFVRASDGPVAVVIRSPPPFAAGRRVVIDGRLLDRLQVVDRRGQAMRYPRIVAAPGAVRGRGAADPGAGLTSESAAIAGLLVVMGAGLLLARRAVRRAKMADSRGRRGPRGRRPVGGDLERRPAGRAGAGDRPSVDALAVVRDGVSAGGRGVGRRGHPPPSADERARALAALATSRDPAAATAATTATAAGAPPPTDPASTRTMAQPPTEPPT
ncbi:MAG: hypothetical protein AB8G96_02290 [Phycisphaerales bacterium]